MLPALRTTAKILRLGVIHGGKIVEERLLRKPQDVVVGESTKNTIVLPESAGVGLSFRLFEANGANYQLAFNEQMDGRVAVGTATLDFSSLKQQGLAKKNSDHYLFGLEDESRGKVVLGDVTVLFQFVSPPPEVPTPGLPREIRMSFLYSLDLNFALYILLVGLSYGVLALYLRSIPIPEEDSLDQLDDRFARMVIPEKKEPPKEPEKPTPEKKSDEKKPEKKVEKVQKLAEDATPEQHAERRKQIQAQVANKGVLAILGTLGNSKGAVADVFGEGKAVNGDIDSAFAGISGVEVARGDSVSSRGGKGAGNTASIGGLGAVGNNKVALGDKSEARVGNVQAEAPEVDGGALDPSAVARVVKSRISAVKECYEHELKRNPKLSGKVVVRFTIDEEGRTNSVAVEENTTGDPQVGQCIVSRFERFRFPKPDGGQVTATYPFVFTPSS